MRQDFVLDDNFKLLDDGDDFAEGDSTQTDAQLILLLQKGEIRYAPWAGYGMVNKLRGILDVNKFIREVKVELENDGHVNPQLSVPNGDLTKLEIFV